MRTTLSILSVCAFLVACDVSKSVGDEGSSTSGADSSPADTESASTTTPVTDTSTTAGNPTTSPSGTSASATATTGGPMCPDFDAGPVGDPDSDYSWECLCQTCDLSFPDIPLETVDQFESGGLCDCLCAEAGCGFVQGEGGVGGGPDDTAGWSETATDTATTGWPDTDSGTATSGWPDTESFGESSGGSVELTVAACLDEGGEIVGDPGDGSVFDPDYVCPGGESPLGILDFEPGMPFPKNGGVCCP